MPSKKVIAGIIISMVTIGTLVALIPVFIYGFGVNALSINTSMGITGSTSVQMSSPDQSYEYMDFGSTSTITINADTVDVNPYEYFFRQFEGPVRTNAETTISLINQYVDITILVNVSTPNAFYEFSFTLDDLVNILQQNTFILLGPDEIEITSGTYEIWVNVIVSISIPDLSYNETFESGIIHIIVEIVVE